MENPLLTFASPSIIDPTGAKTSVFVAIHEIAHSWTGNTVTCGNWSNLWLNEGFTVFLERKAGKELFGDDFYRIESINGNQSLNDAYSSFVKTPEFTKLNPDTSKENPDDSFSEVPYEKGYGIGGLIYSNFLILKILLYKISSYTVLIFDLY